MERIISDVSELAQIAAEIVEKISHPVICFEGEMGAGKTTFIRHMVDQMGSEDEVSSPTFALVNEYMTNKGVVYHFDFYRIEDESEAYDMGLEEYLYSGNACWIEWSQKVVDLLPEKKHVLQIEKFGEKRKIIFR